MEENQPAQSRTSPKNIFLIIILVLLLGAVGFAAVQNRNNNSSTDVSQQIQPENKIALPSPIAPKTLVFGTWAGTSALIKSLDLNSGDYGTIATLPQNVKKVSVLSPTQLLYIDGTNNRDHGQKLTRFQVNGKTSQAAVSATEGFGIDDYVLSPNKQYVATWEVAFTPGSEVLQGGKSRVYAVKLTDPTNKILLYDEEASASAAVHYPSAILDNGRVFADRFTPNDPSGIGHSYGMGVVNFDGSDKQELAQMNDGTYGTQPSLSPDGSSLAFAGYDGAQGDGKTLVGGSRRAILTPNTVELLDVNTLERKKLNLPNNNIYSGVSWDKATGKLIIVTLSAQDNQTGVYAYDLSTNINSKINPPGDKGFVSLLSAEKALLGTTDDSQSTIGNLGEKYASALTNFSVLDLGSSETTTLELNGYMQYIGLLPQGYFRDILEPQAASEADAASSSTAPDNTPTECSQNNIQLCTFALKTELAPVREEQQSLPKCRELAGQQCDAIYPPASRTTVGGLERYKECLGTKFTTNRAQDACYDSPLYLYGTAGKNVNVEIQTSVYNDSPAYNGGYNVSLLDGGKMQVNGDIYHAINYDYRSNLRKIKAPARGAIVARNEVEKVLREYAKKLGLNEKETNYLIKVGKEKVVSPYAFVSFFDHATSKAILPLKFTPEPDNYLNIVFYFKLLGTKPNFTPDPPVFEDPLSRSGLTAVEISEIVE